MIAAAAKRLHQFIMGEREQPEQRDGARHPDHRRRMADSTTMTLRALSDLGDSVASSVHVIASPTRLYLCVSMEAKPDALRAQMEADRRTARGMFEVDENWSAAEVNARWARGAVLTDEDGEVLTQAVVGARGMTDAGAKEVFFEFNAMDIYPDTMYLTNKDMRVRVK